jgi:hypothetical protein
MIKHQAASEVAEETEESLKSLNHGMDSLGFSTDFDSLEEELNNFSININGDLKPKALSVPAQPPSMQSPGSAKDPLERSQGSLQP